MEILFMGIIFPSFHPLFLILTGPTILLAIYAQIKVKSAFTRFNRQETIKGFTGVQAAARILEQAGIYDVTIEMAKSRLLDHYDPTRKKLCLSSEVYQGKSISAIGIAAHEAGHALQHAQGYTWLHLRSLLIPAAGIGSWLAWPMIFLGFALGRMQLIHLGLLLFSVLVFFQGITLPVEINASKKARKQLADTGIVTSTEEMQGVTTVLHAATLTYVAATLTAIAQFVYLLLSVGRRGRGRGM